MGANPVFDRWYAAKHVRIVVSPTHELETFGSTLVNYRLISQLDDRPDKVRVREGRLEAHQPRVITPKGFSEIVAEGFGEAARGYLEWLKENEDNLRILQYGYHLKSDNFSEQVLTDSLAAVTERVKEEVARSGDRFSAVLQGVDDPWDIALVELWRHEVDRSAKKNIRELCDSGKLF
jgi:hypothetical protein